MGCLLEVRKGLFKEIKCFYHIAVFLLLLIQKRAYIFEIECVSVVHGAGALVRSSKFLESKENSEKVFENIIFIFILISFCWYVEINQVEYQFICICA